MQRVHLALGLDAAAGGHQRLGGHLPAEHPLQGRGRRLRAAVEVELEPLDVQDVDELGHGGRHLRHPGTMTKIWVAVAFVVLIGLVVALVVLYGGDGGGSSGGGGGGY